MELVPFEPGARLLSRAELNRTSLFDLTTGTTISLLRAIIYLLRTLIYGQDTNDVTFTEGADLNDETLLFCEFNVLDEPLVGANFQSISAEARAVDIRLQRMIRELRRRLMPEIPNYLLDFSSYTPDPLIKNIIITDMVGTVNYINERTNRSVVSFRLLETIRITYMVETYPRFRSPHNQFKSYTNLPRYAPYSYDD